MNRRALIIVLAAIAGLVAFLAAYKYWRVSSMIATAASFAEPAEAVEVAVAHPITWQAEASAAGTIVARQFVTLSNELAGTVASVAFHSGQIVEQGQVLVELDTRTERAELRSAEADIDLARLTVERTTRLVEQRAGTQAEVDRARAQLAQAEARRDVIATAIARRILRAPFRGRIGLRDVHPGQYLAEGTELTTLESIDASVFVDFRLPQEIAAQLAPGAKVQLSGSALRQPADAVITAIDARADEASRTVRVRAEATGLGKRRQARHFRGRESRRRAPRRPRWPCLSPPSGAQLTATTSTSSARPAATVGVRGPSSASCRPAPWSARTSSSSRVSPMGERVATEGSFKLSQGSLVRIAEPAAQSGGKPPGS